MISQRRLDILLMITEEKMERILRKEYANWIGEREAWQEDGNITGQSNQGNSIEDLYDEKG